LLFPHEDDVRFVFASSVMSYLRYLCLFAYSGVQHIFWGFFSSSCVSNVASFSVSMDCQFWLSLRYSL